MKLNEVAGVQHNLMLTQREAGIDCIRKLFQARYDALQAANAAVEPDVQLHLHLSRDTLKGDIDVYLMYPYGYELDNDEWQLELALAMKPIRKIFAKVPHVEIEREDTPKISVTGLDANDRLVPVASTTLYLAIRPPKDSSPAWTDGARDGIFLLR